MMTTISLSHTAWSRDGNPMYILNYAGNCMTYNKSGVFLGTLMTTYWLFLMSKSVDNITVCLTNSNSYREKLSVRKVSKPSLNQNTVYYN